MSHNFEQSIIPYSEVNVRFLRERARHWVESDQAHLIFGYETPLRFPTIFSPYGYRDLLKAPEFLAEYYRLSILAEEVATQHHKVIKARLSLPLQLDHNDHVFVSNLIRQDTPRVILPVALAAWLTYDEFRWHNHLTIPWAGACPQDLNYGLVLTHPEFVIPYACFILNTHRATQLVHLSKESLEGCEQLSKQIVDRVLKKS